MELKFVIPHLTKLDEIESEILIASVFSDVRPAHGLAGLCDFRLGGRLSRLMKRGFIEGAANEVVMLPGKPLMTFDKILLFGAGERARFGENVYVNMVRRILKALEGLAAKSAVVELPGRHDGAIDSVRAAELLLTEVGGSTHHDAWTLVEDLVGRDRIEKHMVEQKRRIRRMY